MTAYRYFALYKPYDMVSQFVSREDVNLLGDIGFDFPPGTHAIGRLDNLSEGLLLLTTDKRVTRLLFESGEPHDRTYLVKVLYAVSPAALERLRTGVAIRIAGGGYYTTPPCDVHIVPDAEQRYSLPAVGHTYGEHTWLSLTLQEGKYHQVRKMVRAAGHRCQRLVRVSIEDLKLDGLQPGEVRELSGQDFFRLLKIEAPRNTAMPTG